MLKLLVFPSAELHPKMNVTGLLGFELYAAFSSTIYLKGSLDSTIARVYGRTPPRVNVLTASPPPNVPTTVV